MNKGTAFVLFATVFLLFATPVMALEKTAEMDDADGPVGGWTLSTTCEIVYYNTCTGWVWNWSGWSPFDVLGFAPTTCCGAGESSVVDQVSIYIKTAAPPGYNFTGTTELWAADAQDCLVGTPIAQQPYLPATTGTNYIAWGVPVPAHFAATMTLGPGASTPLAIRTDHPAAGPTGPAACGFCYPTTRVVHSFYYGTATTILCPGSPFDDDTCFAELYGWRAFMTCNPISVEEESWARVKSLYR
jgi:hypothetical protein